MSSILKSRVTVTLHLTTFTPHASKPCTLHPSHLTNFTLCALDHTHFTCHTHHRSGVGTAGNNYRAPVIP